MNSNVSTSICPKGWRLPRSGTALIGDDGISNANTGNEFAYAMHKVYDYRNQLGERTIHTGILDNQDITRYPIYLGRVGLVHLPARSLRQTGRGGNILSSTTNTQNNAYGLNVYTNTINSINTGGRSDGYSLRCLAE